MELVSGPAVARRLKVPSEPEFCAGGRESEPYAAHEAHKKEIVLHYPILGLKSELEVVVLPKQRDPGTEVLPHRRCFAFEVMALVRIPVQSRIEVSPQAERGQQKVPP